MNRQILDQWCERAILALVLVILVFTPLAFGGVPQPATGSRLDFFAVNPFALAQWLGVVVMVLWLCRVWLNPGQRLLWPPICWAVLAFTIYAIIRYRAADIEYVAREELIQVLVYAFLFFAILNNLHRQESVQLISFTMIFLAMAISFYALYQFLTGSEHVWHLLNRYPHRGTGTYISPNHLGGFLEMLLPLGLAYTLTSRAAPVAKVLLGYASLVILAGIAVTLSRGSWISIGSALVLFFGVLIFHRKYRLPSTMFLAALLGAGVFFIPRTHLLQTRLKELVSQHNAGEGHANLWPPAIRIWRQTVWWGAGPAHFDYRFPMYRPVEVQLRPNRAHNDVLNTLVDWGIVGTALVASAWVLLALGAIKTWRFVRGTPRDIGEKKNSNKFAFVLGASAGLVAILVHSAVDFNMHIPANAMLAVALMALLTSHLRFATERYWVAARAWLKAPATALVLAGIVYLSQQTCRHAIESGWLARAARAPAFSPAQVAFLTKAFSVERKNPETAYSIGEAFRIQSLDGSANYQELGTKALDWFARAMKLNPWDRRSCLGYGMCLDWLDRQMEAPPYFDRAEQLDPNGYFTVANIGLHYVQLGNYAGAKPWFERSLRLQPQDNPIARNYLELSNRKLMEAATNEFSAKLTAPLVKP